MLATLLLALNLVSCATSNTLNTLRIPTHRKTLNVNTSAVFPHPINYNDDWTALGYYFIELGIGTPPQLVQLGLDTGSSDTWVPLANASDCLKFECPAGAFDPAKSSTYRLASFQPFQIGYIDETAINGNYSIDTVVARGASLSNFSFAVAKDLGVDKARNAHFGLLGLGTKEAQAASCLDKNCSQSFRTPTFTDALVSSGHIESPSYSLFLDDRDSRSGSILFGGIDTAKFTGPLITLHTKPEGKNSTLRGQYVEQELQLTSLTVRINGTLAKEFPLPEDSANANFSDPQSPNNTAAIDSGSNTIAVPKKWVNNLLPLMPVDQALIEKFPHGEIPIMFCDDADVDIVLTFTLQDESGNKAAIDVPFQELVTPVHVGAHDKLEPVHEAGRPICMLALHGRDEIILLGDPFLRSAYTFFNLEQHTISIAQAANNPKSEHIVAIGKGPVPKLVGTT